MGDLFVVDIYVIRDLLLGIVLYNCQDSSSKGEFMLMFSFIDLQEGKIL